jgi:adenylylsulfate kinase-like enzyme
LLWWRGRFRLRLRMPMNSHGGAVVWLTGLSGAGKSTIARAAEAELLANGIQAEVLDGDQIRENFSRGLGYSKLDRHENVRRAGYVAGLLARHGVVVPVALISPYRAARNQRFFGGLRIARSQGFIRKSAARRDFFVYGPRRSV